jgi:DNA processing protein
VTTLHLVPLDARYPSRLRSLARPPSFLSIRGGPLDADRVVAVVGSRLAHPEAQAFAVHLAATLTGAGAVVASGGAAGIDAAAHRGALDAGGRTWVVAGTGCEHCFPPEHAALFDRVAHGPGAMVWPFPPPSEARAGSFVARNKVLVAISDAVVVVQAGFPSGALNAAAAARRLGRPLWVVPPPPWLGSAFDGSRRLLDQGARPLQSVEPFLRGLGLAPAGPVAASKPPPRPLSEAETAVLAATSAAPLHLDEIASRAHSPAPAVMAALLTLALEDVVVEGPPGFFRHRNAS